MECLPYARHYSRHRGYTDKSLLLGSSCESGDAAEEARKMPGLLAANWVELVPAIRMGHRRKAGFGEKIMFDRGKGLEVPVEHISGGRKRKGKSEVGRCRTQERHLAGDRRLPTGTETTCTGDRVSVVDIQRRKTGLVSGRMEKRLI